MKKPIYRRLVANKWDIQLEPFKAQNRVKALLRAVNGYCVKTIRQNHGPTTLPTHQRTAALRRKPNPIQPPPPHRRSKVDCEVASVTPVRVPAAVDRGSWTWVLGSGKVASKVLIVDHM